MEYREYAPPADLTDMVHRLWYLRGGDQTPQPIVPDGRAELIIHIGEPFSVVGEDGKPARQEVVTLAGQITGPLWLQPSAEPEVIGVRFTEWGASQLLGLPMWEITDSTVRFADIKPLLAGKLWDAAFSKGTVDQKIAAIGNVLRQEPMRDSDPLVRMALSKFPHVTGLGDLAEKCAVTERTLQRRFKQVVGMRPKLLARIMRFRRAYESLVDSNADPARIAAVHGYYDQAHLIRDFKEFSGASPRKFLSEQTAAMSDAFLTTLGSARANQRTRMSFFSNTSNECTDILSFFQKEPTLRTVLATALVAFSLPALGQAQESSTSTSVETVSWLAGCWESTSGDRSTVEMWMPPAGGSMFGASRTVAGGRTRAFERLILREGEEGLVYTAEPSGQEEASFMSTLVTDSSFVVENPEHDFPTAIAYTLVSADSIVARVSGESSGFEIRMGRIRCQT